MSSSVGALSEKSLSVLGEEQSLGRRLSARSGFDRNFVLLEVLWDGLAVMIGMSLGYLVRIRGGWAPLSTYHLTLQPGVRLAVAIIAVVLLQRNGAYRGGNGLLRVKETERILRVTLEMFAVALLLVPWKHLSSVAVLLSYWACVFSTLLLEKHLVASLLSFLHARGYGVKKVIIYGAGLTGRRIFSTIVRSPRLGMNAAAFVDDDPAKVGQTVFETYYQRQRSATILPGPVTPEMLREWGAETVVIGIPSLDRKQFSAMAAAASAAGASLAFVPYNFGPSDSWTEYSDLDGTLLASFHPPKEDQLYAAMKRVLDFVVSAAALVLLAPLMTAIAILIRATSPGPALFSQKRVGKNGDLFTMFKFRTMRLDTQAYDYHPKLGSDPRITPIGRFLRRTSLDELPQLFNVLRGEMSLVGPRPEMPFVVAKYEPIHRRRLLVKPGITGLWQLSADRSYLIHENIEYDLYYLRNRNLLMDVAVLLHTFVFAARGI